MPATYEPIATTTLNSAASSIDFTSIPGTYTDLRLIIVARIETNSGSGVFVRFNGDTNTNYSQTTLYGTGTGTGSSAFTNSGNGIFLNENALSTSIPSYLYADIFNYTSNVNKTVLRGGGEDRNGSGVIGVSVGLWRNTATITSINVRHFSVNFASGTTATLYGILRA